MSFLNLDNELEMATEKVKNDHAALLTKREWEIMHLVAQGLSNKQIACKLFVSDETVKKHIRNVFCKINATCRIESLRKLGLIR